MNASRHLQNLVAAQMKTRQDVAASNHDVGKTRIVDHDGVQAAHIERALSRRRHRQQIRFGRAFVFQKRANHAHRFAAVIIGRIQARETLFDFTRGLLDTSARWQKHAHATLFAHDFRDEQTVEKIYRVAIDDLNVSRFFGIERINFQHIARF